MKYAALLGCIWILWQWSPGMPESRYLYVDAFDTKEACVMERERIIQQHGKDNVLRSTTCAPQGIPPDKL